RAFLARWSHEEDSMHRAIQAALLIGAAIALTAADPVALEPVNIVVGHTTRADVLKALDAAGVDVVRSTPIPCEEVVCAAVSETIHVRPEHVQAADQVVRDFASREAQDLQAKSRVRVAYGRQCEPPPPHAPTAARLRAALALAGIEVYA